MKYFLALAVFAFFGGSIALLIIYSARLRFNHFAKMASKAVCSQKTKIFFSSNIIRQAVKILLKKSKSRNALYSLCMGDFTPAIKHLQGMARLQFEALIEPNATLKKLQKIIKEEPQNTEIMLLMADLYAWKNESDKLQLCLDNLENKKLSSIGKAKQKYWQSYFDMQDGDLLSASGNCSLAIGIFKKHNILYEEGQAYFRLGTIYRISALSDVAQMMLETALKIFAELGLESQQAEALGNLGMLMTMDNRTEEAQSYFAKSLDVFEKNNNQQGAAEIINQQALGALIAKQFDNAKALALTALNKHEALKNLEGEALSHELLGHVYSNDKNWNKVVEHAQKAAQFYKKKRNWSAQLESEFLAANALFANQQIAEAEELLRGVIKKSNECKNCFHIANAYNLLGLIFLQKGELLHAKGLFQQSLEYEQKSNRLDGMAIGYANIAITEAQRGLNEQAIKTLETAIEYAKAHGETELSVQLENKLNKMRA